MWRAAVPEDDDAIVRMCRVLNELDPGPDPVPESHVRQTLATLRAEPVRGRVLVFDAGAGAAGYVFLISFWSNELGGEVVSIDEIYLDPPHRGRGHTQWLVKDLLAGGRFWPGNPVVLELEVSPGNERARALYERLGFTPIRNMMMRRRVKNDR